MLRLEVITHIAIHQVKVNKVFSQECYKSSLFRSPKTTFCPEMRKVFLPSFAISISLEAVCYTRD